MRMRNQATNLLSQGDVFFISRPTNECPKRFHLYKLILPRTSAECPVGSSQFDLGAILLGVPAK